MHVITHVSSVTECTPPGVNPKITELWALGDNDVLMRFIRCNECAALVPDVDPGGVYVYVGAGGIREISLPSS